MDVIGDFLTIIRNGIAVSKLSVLIPYSKLKNSILLILKDEGFIRDFNIEGDGVKKNLRVFLKYVDGESVIHEISRVSKPGRRMYRGFKDLKPVIGGLGLSILTSSIGVITNKQAKSNSVGGEIICTVW
jgi:small subunit ribosomal protein S8